MFLQKLMKKEAKHDLNMVKKGSNPGNFAINNLYLHNLISKLRFLHDLGRFWVSFGVICGLEGI